jgi:AcrR family transcriptional regulator
MTGTGTVRPVERKRVQVRREEILTATVRQIQKQGIDALRIADVAAALGVSSALVIYHFQTKENLVGEAFRHAADADLLRMRRITRGSGPARARLLEALRWYAPSGRARGWMLWIDGWASSLRDQTLASVIGKLDREWKQTLADLIEEGVSAGDFVAADPLAAATRITAFIDGMAVNMLVNDRRRSREQMWDWVLQLVAWELHIEPLVDEGHAR